MYTFNRFIERLKDPSVPALLLRIGLAITFINAGLIKLGMIEGVAAYFASIGLPAFLAYVVSYCEFFGGILLLVGLLVRPVSIVLAIIMIGAIVTVHWENGYSLANNGYEYVLLLLIISLAQASLGAGKYSLSRLIRRKR